jgi:hypothetical protein
MNRILLVIRHREEWERTFDLYKEHNINALNPDEVVCVTGEPFSETWKSCLRVCKDIDFDHCFMTDADVYLLNPDYLLGCLGNDFYMEYKFIDKFRGDHIGAIHYYDKNTMDGMYQYLSDDETINSKRYFLDSEWATIRQYCVDNGYGNKEKNGVFNQTEQVVALHDYNQYYEHIFYKYVFRGWRSLVTKENIKHYIKIWNNSQDKDLVVARHGLIWSLENDNEKYEKDSKLMENDILNGFLELNVNEKDKTVCQEEIEEMLKEIR